MEKEQEIISKEDLQQASMAIRQNKCEAAISEALKKYNCFLDVTIHMSARRGIISGQTVVIPRPEDEEESREIAAEPDEIENMIGPSH